MTASRVFLSYKRADEAFVETLYRRLSDHGIECFFDQESIPIGANFVITLQRAIDECNYLVMVMSPAYFDTKYPAAEWSAMLKDDPLNDRGRVIPLLLKPCKPPAFISCLNYVDVSSDSKFEQAFPKIRNALSEPVSNDIEQRNDEIQDLFYRNNIVHGMKRLLDFADDFADRSTINRAVAISANLNEIEENIEKNQGNRDFPAQEFLDARLNLLGRALELKDGVIKQLSFQTTS